jgi:heterodisulfide reductase subunit C
MAAKIEQTAIESFAKEVEEAGGGRVADCYQCGKCSAGCPVASFMDLLPHQVARCVQLGMRDDVLRSATIWVCASCLTCTTRCPKEFEIAHLMDILREISVREGKVSVRQKNKLRFHRAFLRSVESHGRIFELGMIQNFKMRTAAKQAFKDPRVLMQDAMMGKGMLFKRKLRFLPDTIKGKKHVKRIFDRVRRLEKSKGKK